jgi:branched-chain amino acid transport system permease protein
MTRFQIRLVAAAAILCLVVAPYVLNPFSITLLNYIGIYSLVAIGLALLTGVGGIVSFGQAAFVGIAAYATAWTSAMNGHSPWLGLLLAIILTCGIAAVLGFVTLRLGGHFLSLSTVAWGLAIAFLFGNVEGLGRFNGIANIPPISIGSLALVESWQIYFLIWAIVVGALALSYNLLDSRVGRAMRTLRGGNTLVESLGINAFQIKLATFVIAAFLAALSGWLYAHLSRFISPGPFDAGMGIEYLMMTMVGGSVSLLGGVVGAAIVTLLKNSVQDYLPLLAKGASGQLEIVAFSALFILFLQRARQGIVPFLARFLPKPILSRPQPAAPLPRREQPAPGQTLLQVEGAERRFGGLVAVNNVSFEVRSGEILGLIGPNGAGKTTVFNLLTGALRLNSGEIAFAGRSITRDAQYRIAQGGVARTFQHVKLRPRMTLLDNVLLGTYSRTRTGLLSGALRLNQAEEASARYEAVQQLERVGLGDRPFELAGNLPLGNQRVLEIARALAADPLLLVLDEPAAGLRRQEKLKLAELLRSLRADHLTILLVEHDMDFVMTLVDRIVVLDFGSKLCEGEPAAIRSDARVQEAYLGGVA